MSPDLLAGRYEMIERLAGGGMGQVWRGRDRVLERIVAVKTVDLAAQDPTARERFRREAVATAGLSAPNVVQVYDAGIDGDTAYLVMELLTGPSLARLIHDNGPLPIDEGVHVVMEITKGLLAAHRIGVVHRDIKPGNVMYHGDQIKLVDFGIAQLARTMGAQLTAPATALGTAAYMSPEQATGEGATDKSDWYALGCLMMTIFTGQPPFAGEALAVATQQITGKAPSLSQRRPEVPPALGQLVARMLAKDPADRPSGEDVLKQLRLLQTDPNAGTITMPTAAPSAAATAVLPSNGDDATRMAGFAQTPAEPTGPSGAGAVVPAPAPAPAARRGKRRGWPVVVGLLVVLLVGMGAAFAVFNLTQGPLAPPETTPIPAATASPTPTATPTRAPTTTRPPTTRPPATRTTTAPPITAAPETTEPTAAPEPTQPTNGATTDQGNGDDDSNGNGNGNNGGGTNANSGGNSGNSGGEGGGSNAQGNMGNGGSAPATP